MKKFRRVLSVSIVFLYAHRTFLHRFLLFMRNWENKEKKRKRKKNAINNLKFFFVDP